METQITNGFPNHKDRLLVKRPQWKGFYTIPIKGPDNIGSIICADDLPALDNCMIDIFLFF